MEDLDKDLDEEYQYLLSQEKKADIEIEKIESKIRNYSTVAWIFVWMGMLFFLLGLVVYFFVDVQMKSLNLLGDFYGGSVAGLWSLAALLFIFVAFLGQKQQFINQQREVHYNRFELKATRVEILRQREQLVAQNETLSRQRFENTFFQLMNMHNGIVSDLDILTADNVKEKGSDCFHAIFQEFKKLAKEKIGPEKINDESAFEDLWIEFYQTYEHEIGHYIRNLYHIVKFVKESGLSEKSQYGKFVRSRLSSDELMVLFYNCHTRLGRDKFKPLIEQFNLFKNIPSSELISAEHLKWYHHDAYGD